MNCKDLKAENTKLMVKKDTALQEMTTMVQTKDRTIAEINILQDEMEKLQEENTNKWQRLEAENKNLGIERDEVFQDMECALQEKDEADRIFNVYKIEKKKELEKERKDLEAKNTKLRCEKDAA